MGSVTTMTLDSAMMLTMPLTAPNCGGGFYWEATAFCINSRQMIARADAQITANHEFLNSTIRVLQAPVLTTCVLCAAEVERTHRLVFRDAVLIGLSATWSDTEMDELQRALTRIGVCEDCVAKYQGQRRRIVLDANRLLHWLARPVRPD